MAIRRMDHVGVVVDDLEAVSAFFVELGLEIVGEAAVGGGWVDRIVGLPGVRSDIVMLRTPDGSGQIELSKFHSPSTAGDARPLPANARGIRHVAFEVAGIDALVARLRARGEELVGSIENYENTYRLCYILGPEGIIVELAERIA